MAYERWAWVDVDLAAVAENVRTLRGLTAPGTLFMAVVKADGYGHGAVPVARAALAAGAERLGVATVEEALELRRAGLDVPIHLLSEPPPSSAELVVGHSLIPFVTNMAYAGSLNAAASSAGTKVSAHLKIDTGMNRVGVRAEDALELAVALKGFPDVRIEGTATHFATADVPGDWEFEKQSETFTAVLDAMRGQGLDPGIVHAANSAATILHPETHGSMVRCGIAMYGLHPSDATKSKVELKPGMSVKARIAAVKRIGMGEGVSYGFTYRAAAPAQVGLLTLGYADGLHRVLSDRIEVLVSGRRARQVGRITMDQISVEIPRGVEARPGDEAVVVGWQGNENVSMDELAEKAGTINYEMACSFSRRMKVRYRG